MKKTGAKKKASPSGSKSTRSSSKGTAGARRAAALSGDGVLKRTPNVISRNNFDGTVAIMRLDADDCIFTIDGMAAEFWTMIDGKRSVEKICQDLIRKHAPPQHQFKKDVQRLIRDLRAAELIEKSVSP